MAGEHTLRGGKGMELPQEGQNLRMLFFLTTGPSSIMAAAPHRANLTKVQGWRAPFANLFFQKRRPVKTPHLDKTQPSKHERATAGSKSDKPGSHKASKVWHPKALSQKLGSAKMPQPQNQSCAQHEELPPNIDSRSHPKGM